MSHLKLEPHCIAHFEKASFWRVERNKQERKEGKYNFIIWLLQGAISDTDVLAALSGGNTKVGCIKL